MVKNERSRGILAVKGAEDEELEVGEAGAGPKGEEVEVGVGEAGGVAMPKGEKPDFRVVQPGTDMEGKATFANVGGMWKGTSKAGNEFYTMRIGKLKLLVFPNKGKTD